MAQETLNDRDHQHHSSWIAHVIEKLGNAVDNINVDFPLSGGEEPALHSHHSRRLTAEEIEEEQKMRFHWKTSLFHHLDTDFPLSGGQ